MAIVDEFIAVLGYDIQGLGNLKKFNDGIASIDNKLRGFVSKVVGYGSALSGFFLGLGSGSILSTNAEFEKFGVILETIEGNAEKVRESMAWISEFGAKTPYEIGEVTDAFVKLKSYGIDPIANDTLRKLGDTSSAMGKSLMQAVEMMADAATGEFERLKEFGLRATKTTATETTLVWQEDGKEKTRTIKKTNTEIQKALLDIFGNKFSGAMDKQSKTFTGMLSNIQDTFTLFKKNIGDKGFYDTAKTYLQGFLDKLNLLQKNGKLDEYAKSISDALTSMLNAFAFVSGRIGTHVNFLTKHFDKISPYLKVIGGYFAFVLARAFPLITVFLLMAAGIDDFLTYLEGGESLIGTFIESIKEMTGAGDGLAKTLAAAGVAIGGALGLGLLFRVRKTLRLVVAAFALLPKAIGLALALLSNPIGWAVLVAGMGAALIAYFWEDIARAWGDFVFKFKGLLFSITTWADDIDFFGMGAGIIGRMWDGMKNVGSSVKGWFSGLFSDEEKDIMSRLRSQGGSTNRSSAEIGKKISNVSRSSNVVNNITINQDVKEGAAGLASNAAKGTVSAVSKVMTPDRVRLVAEPFYP